MNKMLARNPKMNLTGNAQSKFLVRLCQNATLAVAEEILGADGRVYLRLADGRGWAFDDSALFPHDPSVVRLGRLILVSIMPKTVL